ncbi:C-type cytochrome, putative [hydrothermal vent metagenome]|uniref:C-type cytochrome, putative n=1 Tax=hydrothermal vent metagenome TaxID=652676 RepID=A0A1W1EKX5_9ZZZZ
MKQIILLLIFNISFLDANRLLFFGNCISCHGGNSSAPYMIEIKGYYLSLYPQKEEFVDKMSKWLSNPNRKSALLQNAIKKYKLMPYLNIDIDTLKEISTYIYDNNEFDYLSY